MRTVVLGVDDLEALIARRRASGADLFDEVWEGTYHVAPAPTAAHALLDTRLTILLDPYAQAAHLEGTGPFNLGVQDNFRVPDHGYHRGEPVGTWVPTAAIVVEILSPDDETFDKFGFYAAAGVDELIIVDPAERLIRCFRRDGDGYAEAARSDLLGVSSPELTTRLNWPA